MLAFEKAGTYSDAADQIQETKYQQAEYKREQLDSQLKSEFLTALQPAFAEISEKGIRYSALPGHTTEIADALNEILSKKFELFEGVFHGRLYLVMLRRKLSR